MLKKNVQFFASRILILLLVPLILSSIGCLRSAALFSEPSVLDTDAVAPSCPGITGVTVVSGPALSVSWAEGSDELTSASAITYSIFMRSGTGSYDLVSPTKMAVGETTAVISEGVQLGQTYSLFVTCKDEKGNVEPSGPKNEFSVSVQDQSAPTAPGGLSVGTPSYDSLLLTWAPADDGQGGTTTSQMRYKIYRSTSASVSTAGSPIATLTASTSYTDTNLSPGTTYYYRVVALDIGNNVSIPSNENSATTLIDTTNPALVPNLTASGITQSQLVLSWEAGSDNVSLVGQLIYRVFRCSGSTTCDPYASPHIFESAPGQVSWTNMGLVANTVYVYGVRVKDVAGNFSTNSDRLVTNTAYNSLGTFDVYPSNQEVGVLFGQSVAVANVVGVATGAGAYPDLIVGAPAASEPGSPWQRTGCAYIFAGTAAGVFSSTPTQTICQPSATADGANNRNFGYSMAAGDLDDNGTQDLVIGSPQQDRFFIFRSTLSGGNLSIGASSSNITRAGGTGFGFGLCLGNSDGVGALDIFAISPYENCQGGCSGLTGTGNVVVYNNASVSGSFVLPSLQQVFSPTVALLNAPNSFLIQSSERTVMSCAVGKFDPSDLAQDVLVLGSGEFDHDNNSTRNDGLLSFYRKTASNTWTYQNSLVAFVNTPPALRDGLWGNAIAAVDTDGTGAKELFVGAPADTSAGTAAGTVYGYQVSSAAGNFVLADIGNYFYDGSDQNNNSFGTGIASANIWGNAGGREDLVIGAALDDRSEIPAATSIDIGDVFTFRNNAGIIQPTIQQKSFDISAVNARILNEFGTSLCKGDVNNDGYTDVMVGAPGQSYDPLSLTYSASQGAIYIFYGRSMGEIDFANPSQVIFGPGNQAGARFGQSCDVMDYNADGKQDLLVGSPWRDIGPNGDRGAIYVYYGSSNTAISNIPSATLNAPPSASNIYFGFSMSKGDIDGNGFDDLIVGSPLWDTGSTDSGGAWVFWANNTTGAVMPTTSVTTLLPPFGNAGTSGNPHLANNQPAGNGGTITSMVRSGGWAYVTTPAPHGLTSGQAVGVWNSTSPSGTQFNWFWSVTVDSATVFRFWTGSGVNETAGVSGAFWRRYSQSSFNFGYSVAAFPTVSGSAGMDVVICAPSMDTAAGYIDSGVSALTDIGNCFIYEGKVNGSLSGSYQVMTEPRNEIRYPFASTAFNSGSLFFGSSLTRGDWDYDGVQDLAICATRMRNLEISVNNIGGCFAFYGRKAGVGGFETNHNYRSNFGALRPVPLINDVHFNTRLETQVSNFGHAVMLVDINNNTRPDLIIGEPSADNAGGPANLGANSGRVYIIRGNF